VGNPAGFFVRNRVEFPTQVERGSSILEDPAETTREEEQQTGVDGDVQGGRHCDVAWFDDCPE
jgi:hypothetical protein